MPSNDSEYYKEWYQKNRKKFLAKIAEPIECECGRIVSKGNLSKHRNSKVHKKIVEEREKEEKLRAYDLLLKKYDKLIKKLEAI